MNTATSARGNNADVHLGYTPNYSLAELAHRIMVKVAVR